jgi:hypothetical protein
VGVVPALGRTSEIELDRFARAAGRLARPRGAGVRGVQARSVVAQLLLNFFLPLQNRAYSLGSFNVLAPAVDLVVPVVWDLAAPVRNDSVEDLLDHMG